MFKFGAEACKAVSDNKSEKQEKPSMCSKCDFCDYRCDKLSTMKKHIKTNHIEQKCELCRKEFKTSIGLISHKAKEHHKEEEPWNVEFNSTPKSDNEVESSASKDSKLDEYHYITILDKENSEELDYRIGD